MNRVMEQCAYEIAASFFRYCDEETVSSPTSSCQVILPKKLDDKAHIHICKRDDSLSGTFCTAALLKSVNIRIEYEAQSWDVANLMSIFGGVSPAGAA